MAPSVLSHRRTHNLLLLQKLLNLRDGASPFTLVLDTLEQSAKPVLREFMLRAKISKTKILFVSFQTLRKPDLVDIFITGRKKRLDVLRQEIASHIPAPQPSGAASPKLLVIFDTLHTLASSSSADLAAFLSSLLAPTASVVAVYHTDIPIPSSSPSSHLASPVAQRTAALQAEPVNPYAPDPLTNLLYLSTAILQVSNLSHVIAKKKARDRSVQEPEFGLAEAKEGVLVGLPERNGGDTDGVVIDMEVRRKSGRGVREVFVLQPSSQSTTPSTTKEGMQSLSKTCLLDDHPAYAPPVIGANGQAEEGDEEVPESTFNLGLTEKQRRDRESVVLPYFDAQRGDGPGEGGRILYDMDMGDDFDEEEDEI